MQQWEYKTVFRIRGLKAEGDRKNGALATSAWDIDIAAELAQLGDDGWELVAVTPRSSLAGGAGTFEKNYDFAGLTNEEVWIFKRPKG